MTTARAISVVIPLQDEQDSILALLGSIGRQTCLPAEVVLVDAGSRDRTIERARSVELGIPIRILKADRVYPGVARNEGVGAARFDWIAFTDGGIVLDPAWLSELLAAATEGIDVVFGDVEPVCDSLFRECVAIAYVAARHPHGTRGPSVASCLIRRATFLAAGGFPSYRAAEDLVFFERLRGCGAAVAVAPKAVVHWQLPGSVARTFARLATYSHHNLIAGWGRHWHLGVTRLYAGLFATMLIAYASGVFVLVWLAPPAFFVARAIKAGWTKRGSFRFATLSPGRVSAVALLLLVIDAATATGVLRWLRGRLVP